jgi:hypothetical protein
MLTTSTITMTAADRTYPQHFTLDDALARVGRQVRVVTTIPDVPVDTLGTVLAVSGGNERAMVLVEWTTWRPVTTAASRQTTPLARWFNRPDYEESLVEV